jgi:carboxypeptidase Taq
LRLGQAAAILGLDQQVNMPPGGALARSEQLATLSKFAHDLFVTDEIGKLIEEAEAEVKTADYDSDDAALVRVVRHDYDLETRLPSELVQEIARTQALAHEVWAKAREANDFPAFIPMLEKIFDLMRQKADALGYEDRPYDALLNQFEPNMKTADAERLFTDLRTDLVPFVADIFANLDKVDNSLIHLNYDLDKQAQFGE